MELIESDGLDQVAVAPSLAGLIAVALLAPASQRDDRGRLAPRFLSNPPRGIEAVETRHPDVHQDHLGAKLCRPLNRLDAVVGKRHFVSGELEHHAEAFCPIPTVVHHEHPAAGGRRQRRMGKARRRRVPRPG